jgi:hypothetical protein
MPRPAPAAAALSVLLVLTQYRRALPDRDNAGRNRCHRTATERCVTLKLAHLCEKACGMPKTEKV